MQVLFVKWTVLALMTLYSAACAEDLHGRYVMEGLREAASELILKPNGTFEFSLIYGAADYWGGGSWKQVGNAIRLESSPSLGKPFVLRRSGKHAGKGLKISIVGSNRRGVADIDVIVEGPQGALRSRTNMDGEVYFDIDSGWKSVGFEVSVYNHESGFTPLDPKSSDFEFEVNGRAIMEMRFEGEVLTIKEGYLELRKFDPDKPQKFRKH